jgi:Ca2+-binding RTX toxin-like protein
VGGEGLDLASYLESGSSLRVDLAAPGLSTGEAAGDVFEGIEGLQGGAWHDTLMGDGQANLLQGLAGQDLLDGRTGNDTLQGGDGFDTLLGGTGDDRLEGGRHGDRLEGGEGDDRLEGGEDNDLLHGGAGADTLDGGLGSDRLEGGAGDDWLAGQAGADTFVFASGADVVADFRDLEDKIVLDRALWQGVTPTVASLLSGATVTDTGLHLDFGNGNTLDIHGIFNANLLADDILFM